MKERLSKKKSHAEVISASRSRNEFGMTSLIYAF